MSKFEKVKKYYNSGLWNRKMVENAVIKGWITETEAKEILTSEETE
ncbi:MAG: XkdX family protein [Candidatus Ornithomonoglobus sp.]